MLEPEDFPDDEVIAEIYCHIIFWTPKLQPVLSPEMLAKACEEMDQAMFTVAGEALAAGGSENHLHILARMSPEYSVQQAIDALEARSASMVARECEVPNFAWKDESVAVTISPEELGAARGFIENQASHHEIVTFQSELKAIFYEHGFEYDERKLFA